MALAHPVYISELPVVMCLECGTGRMGERTGILAMIPLPRGPRASATAILDRNQGVPALFAEVVPLAASRRERARYSTD